MASLTPEYIAETRGSWITVPAVTMTIVVPVFVATRIWARFLASRKSFLDDWALVAAMVLAIVQNVLFIVMALNGFGHHIDAIPAVGDSNRVFILYWLVQQIYKISLHTVKVSLVLFYWRLFKTIRWFKWGCIGMLGIIIIYTVITVFIGFFQCTPVERAWNKEVEGTCIDFDQFWVANAGFSISTDFIILLMPIPLIMRLRISLYQKLGLIPVFGLGAFVTAISIFRLKPLKRAAESEDITYDVEATMWTIIELNLAIICASLPWTWVLLTRLWPDIFGRSRVSTNRSEMRDGTGKNGNTWTRADLKYGDGRTVTGTYSANRCDSEEAIAPSGTIQKTVGYAIEYSDDKLTKGNPRTPESYEMV